MPWDRPARNCKRDFGCEERLRKRRTFNSFSMGRYPFDHVFAYCGDWNAPFLSGTKLRFCL
jgi:hypothetical protein